MTSAHASVRCSILVFTDIPLCAQREQVVEAPRVTDHGHAGDEAWRRGENACAAPRRAWSKKNCITSTGPGGMRYLRTCSEGSKSTCFGHILLNHDLQTRRKPTGHWWVECGKKVVGKTVNSERAGTDPVRTYVPGNGRQAPAKRAQTARVAPALHLLRLNLSPHYLADQCFYFKRSRGPGSRRGFAQGQS